MSRVSRHLSGAHEQEARFDHGDVVVREGEPGNEMYVITSGAVVVSRSTRAGEVELARLGKGEFFGEMSVLEGEPRDATVRADGPTTLLVLGQGALLLRLRRDPSFALEMLHRLSSRIRALNQRVGGAGDADPAP